jgi:uncharacterized RDD family membrane protein YckC
MKKLKAKKIQKVIKKELPNYATKLSKFKSFLLDSFMLLMPIMYIVFYLLMGSREAFSEHKIYGWIEIIVPFVLIQTLLFFKLGQTPGYKAYNLYLIDEQTKQKPSLGVILFRNACAILSFFSIFGWIMMFFRKDYKTLHDILSNTAVIQK